MLVSGCIGNSTSLSLRVASRPFPKMVRLPYDTDHVRLLPYFQSYLYPGILLDDFKGLVRYHLT
jgi:hypothetical protein